MIPVLILLKARFVTVVLWLVLIRGSSVVEQSAVNRRVAGSSPARGANYSLAIVHCKCDFFCPPLIFNAECYSKRLNVGIALELSVSRLQSAVRGWNVCWKEPDSCGAGEGGRTLDLVLGKDALYHWATPALGSFYNMLDKQPNSSRSIQR